MHDFTCLICEKMKGDEIYNESIKQNFVLLGNTDVVENEIRVNKIWGPPDHLTKILITYDIIKENQLNLNICASFFQHPHMQMTEVSYHFLWCARYSNLKFLIFKFMNWMDSIMQLLIKCNWNNKTYRHSKRNRIFSKMNVRIRVWSFKTKYL